MDKKNEKIKKIAAEADGLYVIETTPRLRYDYTKLQFVPTELNYAIAGFHDINEACKCALDNNLQVCIFGKDYNNRGLLDAWEFRHTTSRGIAMCHDAFADKGYDFYDQCDLPDLYEMMQQETTTSDIEHNRKAETYYTAVIKAVSELENSNKEIAARPYEVLTITVLDQYAMFEIDELDRKYIVAVA